MPPDVHVIRIFAGSAVDRSTADSLAAAADHVAACGVREMVVDLSEVAQIDAAGVRALVAVRVRCALRGVAVRFTPATEDAQAVVEDAAIEPPLRFTPRVHATANARPGTVDLSFSTLRIGASLREAHGRR